MKRFMRKIALVMLLTGSLFAFGCSLDVLENGAYNETEYRIDDEVVIIPDFITELDFASLRQSAKMKTVIFHEKLTRIGREAF